MRRKDRPGHHYGLPAIATRMGLSIAAMRKLIAKEHFPAYHRAGLNACGGCFYEWYTNDMLIAQWEQVKIQDARDSMVRSSTGRKISYTRGSPGAMIIHRYTQADEAWIDPV